MSNDGAQAKGEYAQRIEGRTMTKRQWKTITHWLRHVRRLTLVEMGMAPDEPFFDISPKYKPRGPK